MVRSVPCCVPLVLAAFSSVDRFLFADPVEGSSDECTKVGQLPWRTESTCLLASRYDILRAQRGNGLRLCVSVCTDEHPLYVCILVGWSGPEQIQAPVGSGAVGRDLVAFLSTHGAAIEGQSVSQSLAAHHRKTWGSYDGTLRASADMVWPRKDLTCNPESQIVSRHLKYMQTYTDIRSYNTVRDAYSYIHGTGDDS